MVNKIDRQKYKGIYSIPCIPPINLLWPNDTIWWYGPWSALAQVMAWCVTALSHCLSQCWFIVNWTIRNKFQWNFNENNKFSIDVNASESIICEMAAILSKGRWVGNDFEHAPINTNGDLLHQIYSYLHHQASNSSICIHQHFYDHQKPNDHFCLPYIRHITKYWSSIFFSGMMVSIIQKQTSCGVTLKVHIT